MAPGEIQIEMKKLINKWNSIPVTVKVSTSYAICSILQKCLSFITLPIFTRLLTAEQYGQVTIYTSWHGILQLLLTLNLAYGSFSTAMIKFKDDRDGYISSVEGICLALSIVFSGIYFPFRYQWNQLFELPTYIILFMIAETLGTTALSLWSGKKRFEFKYVGVITITLLISVISPIIQYILVITHDEKGYYRIIGEAAVNIIVGGIFFFLNIVKGRNITDRKYWKFALKFNIPLLAYYLSQVIFNQSDRIMISHMVGKDKAAMYGVAYSLAMVLTFVLNAIDNSYVPWLYEKIESGKGAENKKFSLIIAAFIALLLSGVIWFAPEIILIMGGEKYVEAVNVVPPVAISLLLLFYSQLFINVEFFYEEKSKLVWASISAAMVNLVLNRIFIEIFGFVAAAYTTLASYLIFALANQRAMKRIIKEKGQSDNLYDYKKLLLLFVIFVGVSAVGVALYGSLFTRIAVCVVALALMVLKRNVLIKYMRIIFGGQMSEN